MIRICKLSAIVLLVLLAGSSAVALAALHLNHQLEVVRAEVLPGGGDPSILNDVLAGIHGPAFGRGGTLHCMSRGMVRKLSDRLRYGPGVVIDRFDICRPRVPESVASHLLQEDRDGQAPWWQWALTSEILYRFAPREALVSAYSAYWASDRGLYDLARRETGRPLTDLNEDELLLLIAGQDAKEECDRRRSGSFVRFPGTRSCSELARDNYERLRSYLAETRAWRAEHGAAY